MLKNTGLYKFKKEAPKIDHGIFTYVSYTNRPIISNTNTPKVNVITKVVNEPVKNHVTYTSNSLPKIKATRYTSYPEFETIKVKELSDTKPVRNAIIDDYMRWLNTYRSKPINEKSNIQFKNLISKPYSYYIDDSTFKSFNVKPYDCITENTLNDFSYDSDDSSSTFKKYAPTDEESEFH